MPLQEKDYTHLGRSGLRVGRLVLGTMNFGPVASEADSFAIMDKALEVGINCFDTANIYGGNLGPGFKVGLTEEIMGRWFAKGNGRREKVVLATKVYGSMDRPGSWPNTSKLSARHIIEQCDASLRRMKTDRIDLYQMHHIDRDAPWDEIWQAMGTLIGQGKILYVGSSNFAGWHVTQAMESARGRGLVGLVSEQCQYNLANRMPELELLPACRAYGVGVICWSPLSAGLLAVTSESGAKGRRDNPGFQDRIKKNRPSLDKYQALCREIGAEPAAVALAWLLSRPGVTGPIVGPRTVAQLEQALPALDVSLSAEVLKRLDEIWPGPGKEGPEAWSW